MVRIPDVGQGSKFVKALVNNDLQHKIQVQAIKFFMFLQINDFRKVKFSRHNFGSENLLSRTWPFECSFRHAILVTAKGP